MTIRRQYQLPNCSLILDGWSDEPSYGENGRPTISVVTNVECYFSSQSDESSSLKGDREFLESLVRVVNHYAQSLLSGLELQSDQDWVNESVSIEPIPGTNHHRLQYTHQEKGHPHTTNQIDLSNVALFDLVEAIDQILNDGSTLPELSLSLKPHSRRVRRRQQSVTQQVAPAMTGVASLMIAAIALAFLPVPEIREPEPQNSEEQTSPQQNDEGIE